MSSIRFRIPVLLPILLCLLLMVAGTGPSRADAQQTPEQILAEKYAPVLMLREQRANCDYAGEGYFPTTVDWLFGNPDINLMAKGSGGISTDYVLKNAPTAQDLATAGPDTYLDFPGNSRNPGCTYETYFKKNAAERGLKPSVYVKYIYSPSERRLYLQYWYWFYFNDWNDTHESDWEMFALGFNAETAEQALAMEPSWVGYAQHGGGETARWNGDDKLQRDGNHPIAYLSAGSHATYYDQSTMIGWGENGSAFGCDVTRAPSRAVHPNVVVIPDLVDANGEFAWTLFQGRWGERQVAMYSGPLGPNMGKKWLDPEAAFGNWRPVSLTIPTSSNPLGLSTTDLFCSLSEKGSRAFVYFGSQPWTIGLIVAALLGLVIISVWRVWILFIEALDVYGKELRTFLGIGIFAIPIGFVFNALRIAVSAYPPLSWITQFFNQSSAGQLAATLLVAVFQQLAMLLLIAPAIIYAMREIRQGVKPGVWQSYAQAWQRLPSLLVTVAVMGVLLVLLSWSVILVPVAIYLTVRLQFFPHAIVLDDARGVAVPLGRSWRVTKGRWLHTFTLTLAFQLFSLLPGPLIGVALLIVGGSNVQFANAVSSLMYGLFLPLSAIGITLAYRRLQGQPIIEPQTITTERDPKRAAAIEKLRQLAQEGQQSAL